MIVFLSVHVHNENDDLVILFVSFEQQQGEQGLRSAIFEALIYFLVEDMGGDGVKDQQSTYHYPLFTNFAEDYILSPWTQGKGINQSIAL